MGGPASGLPARAYSWPPFAVGNRAALHHGAFSPRVFEPLARELAAGLLAARPALEPYGFAVAAWAEAEARAALLREHLASRGMFDEHGGVRDGPLRWLVQFEKRAEAGRRRLGLDPRSHAELLRERAEATRSVEDLGAVRQRGREALRSAERGARGG
jgi:hypothetical protein